MHLALYLIAVSLSVTVLNGCASRSEPQPGPNFFRLDSDNPQRFSFTQEWGLPEQRERSEAAPSDGQKGERGRRGGHARKAERRDDDLIEEQRGEMSQQLLSALDDVLHSRNLCVSGYRVLDVQRQPARMTLVGECR